MKIRAAILLGIALIAIPHAASAASRAEAPAQVDTSVVQKMAELRKGAKEDFDPNVYFKVLTHIAMESGYVLDSVYWEDSLGSYPCLYARKTSEPRKKIGPLQGLSSDQLRALRDSLQGICDGKNIVNLLSVMTADGSADASFQLSLFLKVARQFRLGWHAAYNDVRILTSASDIDRVVEEVNSFGGRNQKGDPNKALWQRARKWLQPPQVVLGPDTAEVTYATFTKWGGFARVKDTFTRTSPPALVKSETLDTIEYDCGIRF